MPTTTNKASYEARVAARFKTWLRANPTASKKKRLAMFDKIADKVKSE